ncbi:uncharacterized protein GGS22DRAFT_167006 [Annulohypoxylon maeteangense]|uniref:uncharacterized protein n=1 Tax=Annulohypoxylon maeteangense TaxID=1927788 RepID=UPI0020081E37|nr:uncharacterized protein GGS22DRAFT_167006 [Annulohypoxylon maeteangense]KAI0883441.1 hypothetical protein GGS22DRAFT_167006 [Annulohypoxylon maeteangense]
MSTKSLRRLIRLPLTLTLQPTNRPAPNIIPQSPRTPHLRPLSSTPRPAKARPSAHRANVVRIQFTEADIPPLSFWETHAKPPLIPADTVTPEDCHAACQDYVPLALENKPDWRRVFNPFFTLHYVAVILLNTPGNTSLALHILHTGIALNYAPSILTVARLAFKTNKLDDSRFVAAKEGLGRLSSPPRKGPGSLYRPDALTLSGLAASALQTPKDDERALKFFEEAASVYASVPNAEWQWRTSAVLEQSKIRLRQKRPDLAREVLENNVRELDNAEVLYAYAMLLPDSDPARVRMIERAAISASPGAAREMGRIELERASQPGLSERDRRDRWVFANEWFRIAGDKSI